MENEQPVKNYLQYGLLFVVAVMPLLSPLTLEPEWIIVTPENAKSAWGLIGGLLLLSVWLLQGVYAGGLHIRKSPLFLPLAGLILWAFVSLFWVENDYLAIVRVAQLFSYGLLLFLVLNLMERGGIARLINALSVSLLLVSLVGIAQYYLTELVWVQKLFIQTAAPASTFANKNMASHFVVMTLPLVLVGLLRSNGWVERGFTAVVLFTGSLYLILIAARQGYLAIAVEIVLLLLFFALDYWKNREQSLLMLNRPQRINLVVLSAVVLLLSLVLNGGGDEKGGTNRVERIKSINIDAGYNRISVWQNSLEMIKDSPLLGVGIGQWSEHYHRYYDRVVKDVIYNDRKDLTRLHNDYIEVFSELGLVGYLFLLWLLYLVVRKIFKVLLNHQNPDRWLAMGLAMGLVGFTVVAMFSFPVSAYLPAALVFIYIGVIFLLNDVVVKGGYRIWSNRRGIVTGFVLVALLLVAASSFSTDWLRAEGHDRMSVGYRQALDTESAANEQLKSTQLNPLNPEYQYKMGQHLAMLGRYEESIPYFKRAVEGKPYSARVQHFVATVYGVLQQYDLEHAALERAIELDPHHVRATVSLVTYYLQREESQTAAKYYDKLKENYLYFRERREFGPYHNEVGQMASSVGDYAFAKFVYESAIEQDPSGENYAKLATIEFFRLGNKDKGVALYQLALKKDPMLNKHLQIRRLIRKYLKDRPKED